MGKVRYEILGICDCCGCKFGIAKHESGIIEYVCFHNRNVKPPCSKFTEFEKTGIETCDKAHCRIYQSAEIQAKKMEHIALLQKRIINLLRFHKIVSLHYFDNEVLKETVKNISERKDLVVFTSDFSNTQCVFIQKKSVHV